MKFLVKQVSRSHSRNSQYRNNYSRSNSNQPEFLLLTFLNQILGIEIIQTIEILDIKIIDLAINLTTDQNIIIIKIDHATIHRTEIQAITIDKGTTLNHLIGITQVNKIHHKIIGVVHLNIKDK